MEAEPQEHAAHRQQAQDRPSPHHIEAHIGHVPHEVELDSSEQCPPTGRHEEGLPPAPSGANCKHDPHQSRGLGGNHILTLDQAAGVLPRPDVPEDDIAL